MPAKHKSFTMKGLARKPSLPRSSKSPPKSAASDKQPALLLDEGGETENDDSDADIPPTTEAEIEADLKNLESNVSELHEERNADKEEQKEEQEKKQIEKEQEQELKTIGMDENEKMQTLLKEESVDLCTMTTESTVALVKSTAIKLSDVIGKGKKKRKKKRIIFRKQKEEEAAMRKSGNTELDDLLFGDEENNGNEAAKKTNTDNELDDLLFGGEETVTAEPKKIEEPKDDLLDFLCDGDVDDKNTATSKNVNDPASSSKAAVPKQEVVDLTGDDDVVMEDAATTKEESLLSDDVAMGSASIGQDPFAGPVTNTLADLAAGNKPPLKTKVPLPKPTVGGAKSKASSVQIGNSSVFLKIGKNPQAKWGGAKQEAAQWNKKVNKNPQKPNKKKKEKSQVGDDWEIFKSGDRLYYHHRGLRITQWEKPSKAQLLLGQQKTKTLEPLPVMKYKEQIINHVKQNRVTIISGETGCGKTTQVPQFLVDDPEIVPKGKYIIVTQPRKIAAITNAERVCVERGLNYVGKEVGYQIRFHNKTTDYTRLIFVTTAVVLRRLFEDPLLKRCAVLVVDEVHERDIHSEFLLTVIKEKIRTGEMKHLRLVLMTATFANETFVPYFKDVRQERGDPNPESVLSFEGRCFPIKEYYLEDALKWTDCTLSNNSDRLANVSKSTIEEIDEQLYTENKNDSYNENHIRSLACDNPKEVYFEKVKLICELVKKIDKDARDHLQDHARGSILIFLPGWRDIKTVAENLKRILIHLIYPMHCSNML